MPLFSKFGSGLRAYLSSGTPESSNRLNMFITVLNYIPVGLAVAFAIIWQVTHNENCKVEWLEIAGFITAMTAFYGMIFGLKAVNTNQETKQLQAKQTVEPPQNQPQ